MAERKAISLFLIFSILLLSGNMFAKERKGADLIVQKTDGQQVRGELIAVKQNSLLLLDRESGADVTVDIDDIRVVKIVKKSTWKRAKKGFLIWGVTGTLIATAAGAAVWGIEISSIQDFMFFLRLFVFWGVIGALIGSLAGTDKIIQIEGVTYSGIKEILEKLRKKARVRYAQ